MNPKKLRPFWTAVSIASFIIRHSSVAVAGALFILVAIIGFMEGGKYSPMISSGIGTWLLIRSRDRSRKSNQQYRNEIARNSNKVRSVTPSDHSI